ncbi:MAG: hypothetical protein AAGC60_17370 [Acidobacteriota bacterium]
MHIQRSMAPSGVLHLFVLLTLALGLTVAPSMAQDEEPMDSTAPPPLPFMEVEPEEPLFHAIFSLSGLDQPTLRLINPDAENPLDLQVLAVGGALDGAVRKRSLVMQIEPGASQSLDRRLGRRGAGARRLPAARRGTARAQAKRIRTTRPSSFSSSIAAP